MNRTGVTVALAILLSCAAVAQKTGTATACARLAGLALPQAKITSAQAVAQGAFTPPSTPSTWLRGEASLYKSLAPFCRVTAVATPSADSDIKIEVWMPASGWNGKFQGTGNGGFAGEIDYRLMGVFLSRGYATAGTDTGHAGGPTDASWALRHPEKVIDFGYRGIHQMTDVAKSVMGAFYGRPPQHSYFASCSNGGRQALMEAQRFPADYDGIMAGAPANFWTHLLTSTLWDAQATALDAASYIPSSKLPAIAHAVNAACDAQDGVSDGILNDPRQCHFDPASMLCKSGDSDSCLTAAQVTALKKLYQGAHDSRGHAIFPGFLPGAELGSGGWGTWITGSGPGKSLLFAFSEGYFSNMVYGKPGWDYKTAKLDQAVKDADKTTSRVLNATNPDLKPFQARGGKLILYHGWNDPAISALNSIAYYDQVVATLGRQTTESFVRLYMVPGMQHCFGGLGPDSFGESGTTVPRDPEHDMQLALEQWVEQGTAPSTIIATKYAGDGMEPAGKAAVKMMRPLCPYPQSAHYKGSGDPNQPGSFTCESGRP